ncbi:hypothetical protein MKEN_00980900 [Mycena kentingensis (nom. inval.)]|nr:hypothetical protein MKEN_00980900 [Mycena kentingensis (nom. inval.)]
MPPTPLPNEVFLHILKNVSHSDLLNVATTNRALSGLARTELFANVSFVPYEVVYPPQSAYEEAASAGRAMPLPSLKPLPAAQADDLRAKLEFCASNAIAALVRRLYIGSVAWKRVDWGSPVSFDYANAASVEEDAELHVLRDLAVAVMPRLAGMREFAAAGIALPNNLLSALEGHSQRCDRGIDLRIMSCSVPWISADEERRHHLAILPPAFNLRVRRLTLTAPPARAIPAIQQNVAQIIAAWLRLVDRGYCVQLSLPEVRIDNLASLPGLPNVLHLDVDLTPIYTGTTAVTTDPNAPVLARLEALASRFPNVQFLKIWVPGLEELPLPRDDPLFPALKEYCGPLGPIPLLLTDASAPLQRLEILGDALPADYVQAFGSLSPHVLKDVRALNLPLRVGVRQGAEPETIQRLFALFPGAKSLDLRFRVSVGMQWERYQLLRDLYDVFPSLLPTHGLKRLSIRTITETVMKPARRGMYPLFDTQPLRDGMIAHCTDLESIRILECTFYLNWDRPAAGTQTEVWSGEDATFSVDPLDQSELYRRYPWERAKFPGL